MILVVHGVVSRAQAWVAKMESVSCYDGIRSRQTNDEADAYHAYTTIKSTIINYATTEQFLATEDWFAEKPESARYG